MTIKPQLIETAYVVKDIDKALQFWLDAGNAGPFFVGESICSEGCVYRGKPLTLHTRYAFGMVGDIAVELVQQLDDTPSVFSEVLQKRGEGLHHLKYATPNREQALEQLREQGYEEISRLQLGEITLSFVDTGAGNGAFQEIMDYALWQPVFQALQRSRREWDGSSDPVRPWEALMNLIPMP